MRRIIAIVTFGLLAACGGAAPKANADTPAPAPKPSMADMQAAALEVEAASVDDAAKLAALYAPDATLWMPGYPEAKGREAIQKFNEDWIDANRNMAMAVARTWTKGNVLVSEQVYTGTDKATGKPWGLSTLDIATFGDNGLIAKDHFYADVVTMLKQLGTYEDERPFRPIATMPTAVEAHVSKGDATEDANVAGTAAINDAYAKGDDAAKLAPISDDFVWNSFTLWEPKDKKWLKEAIVANDNAIKERTWTPWTLLGVEDFTISEGEQTATQNGGFNLGKIHIANTHKKVTLHGVTILQWKDGKVIKQWDWANGQEIDQQLQIRSAAPNSAAKPASRGRLSRVTTEG